MNEDLLNVIGRFSEVSLDCVEKQNEEIEQLEKENQQLKDRINKAINDIDKLEKDIMSNTIIGFNQFIPSFNKIKDDLKGNNNEL